MNGNFENSSIDDYNYSDLSNKNILKRGVVNQQQKPDVIPKTNLIITKDNDQIKSKPGNIKIDVINKVESDNDKSSDFDDYNDDLSNLNRPQSPENEELSRERNASKLALTSKDSTSSHHGKVAITNDTKPVTVPTGPILDPPPNAAKSIKIPNDPPNVTQTIGKNEMKNNEKNFKDAQSGPQHPMNSEPKFPKRFAKTKDVYVPASSGDECDALFNENSSLISQLIEFTSQMDSRMYLLKNSK